MSVSYSSFYLLFSAFVFLALLLSGSTESKRTAAFCALSWPSHEESLPDGVNIIDDHLEVDRSFLRFAPLFELGTVKIL